MKTFVKTIIAMAAIIILGLALAQNTEAAPKYAKNVSDFNYNHTYVLEAAEIVIGFLFTTTLTAMNEASCVMFSR